MKNKLYNKIVNQMCKLVLKGQQDELIYGNQFWEFNDRKIELLNPKTIGKNWNVKSRARKSSFK